MRHFLNSGYISLLFVAVLAFTSSLMLKKSSIGRPERPKINIRKVNPARTGHTKLWVTFESLGAGPGELFALGALGFALFGPDTVKEQLLGNFFRDAKEPQGIYADRTERIKGMQEFAEKQRKARAWARVREAIENDDPVVLGKMAEFQQSEETEDD